MAGAKNIAVIDIGKTNAKVAVVDLDNRTEIAVKRTPNRVLRDGPYPHFDIEALWAFVTRSLRELNAVHLLDAISVTTHGAAAVLVDAAGDLALPVLDYEFMGPDEFDAEYAAARPDFSEAYTPPLPGGLNLGKQIFWQARRFPTEFARTRWILPYPQYWSFRLSGVPASEITSLGCHTHLWDFRSGRYSSLAEAEDWVAKLPDVRPASDQLGVVLPGLAAELGLGPTVAVHSGIHDSNASLLPHVLTRTPPYSVVSTGTWVIVCSPGGDLAHLDPSRDSLANIDALGHLVPSARFMGGREYSTLVPGDAPAPSRAAVDDVLERQIILLPSVVNGSGPFPDRTATWSLAPERLDAERRHAVVSFYLALMTAECLALTGAGGPTVVEGPFAANALFVTMLWAATGRPVEANPASTTGTAVGAALLARMPSGGTAAPAAGKTGQEIADFAAMTRYAEAWRAALQR